MRKSRRKGDIIVRVERERAELRAIAEQRAAFLKPRPRSWHDVFLAALSEGRTIAAAARAAAISRSGVRHARGHEPGFEAAFRRAYAAGLARRHPPRSPLAPAAVERLSAGRWNATVRR